MNKFRQTFKNKHAVLPVIHVANLVQTKTNADIAFRNDADGVLLINHAVGFNELLNIAESLRSEYPENWIGLNALGVAPADIFNHIDNSINGIWVDNAGIDEREVFQNYPGKVMRIIQEKKWTGLYFGGVAFKYQRVVHDLETASKIAISYMDVVTTSGLGTGRAADIEKITRMKQAVGDFPLAIASGITPYNIEDYLPISDCYLVATGINKVSESNDDYFDEALLTELVRKVRRWDGKKG